MNLHALDVRAHCRSLIESGETCGEARKGGVHRLPGWYLVRQKRSRNQRSSQLYGAAEGVAGVGLVGELVDVEFNCLGEELGCRADCARPVSVGSEGSLDVWPNDR
jgi:hypothetical protein